MEINKTELLEMNVMHNDLLDDGTMIADLLHVTIVEFLDMDM